MKFFVIKALMFFDFFHKRKILLGLKKLLGKDVKIIFDVGGHNGESILLFNKNFNFFKVYTFEPLKTNFLRIIFYQFLIMFLNKLLSIFAVMSIAFFQTR